MDLPTEHRRRLPENIVPMINVVFLLLIFFLMTAQIAPPAPFEVTPPHGTDRPDSPGTRADLTVYLSKDGTLAFHDARGQDAVLTALATARDALCHDRDCATAPPALVLRADGGAPAAGLAALMPDLARAGFGTIRLVTQPAVGGATPQP